MTAVSTLIDWAFFSIINARVNRVTRLTPKSFGQSHVPHLVSLCQTNYPFTKNRSGWLCSHQMQNWNFPPRLPNTFHEGVFWNWKCSHNHPPTYTVEDFQNQSIQGNSYEPELTRFDAKAMWQKTFNTNNKILKTDANSTWIWYPTHQWISSPWKPWLVLRRFYRIPLTLQSTQMKQKMKMEMVVVTMKLSTTTQRNSHVSCLAGPDWSVEKF